MNDIILPPIELQDVHKAIQSELNRYSEISIPSISDSISLLKNCAPYIVTIKSTVGVTDEYYLRVSTWIVSVVLNNVISVVNFTLSVQENDIPYVIMILREAWTAMLYMDKFDMEPSFRSVRYDTNYTTLEKLIGRSHGFSSSIYRMSAFDGFCDNIDTSDLDLRTEEEFFNKCRSAVDCEEYIERFPQGKYIGIVQQKLMEYKLKACRTISDCEQFISTCSDGALKDKAIAQLHVLQVQQEELKARRKEQNDMLAGCKTLDEVLDLFLKGRFKHISPSECSWKAYSLCSGLDDYRRLVKVFGEKTKGGDAAQLKIVQIEAKERKKRNILLSIIIPVIFVCTIYLIWGFRGIHTICVIVAVLGGLFAMGNLYSTDQRNSGCGFFLLGVVVAVGFGIASGFLSDLAQEEKLGKEAKRVYKQFNNKPTTEQCYDFLEDYGATEYADNVRGILLDHLVSRARSYDYASSPRYSNSSDLTFPAKPTVVLLPTPLDSLIEFSESNSSNEFGQKAENYIVPICDSLYNSANTQATIDAWKKFQSFVPQKYWKDSEAKIQEIEMLKWNTESKAWATASKENTISAYQKYLSLYRNGAHRSQAERRLIDLEVEEVFEGAYGALPSMEKICGQGGHTSYISVKNNTSYDLTLLYSGPTSKKYVLLPGQTSSIELRNGKYKIVASVSASNVRRYAGTEELSGGRYDVVYYIVTH